MLHIPNSLVVAVAHIHDSNQEAVADTDNRREQEEEVGGLEEADLDVEAPEVADPQLDHLADRGDAPQVKHYDFRPNVQDLGEEA